MLTHFSLFTGIGGLDLAGEMAGFTTVGQCEWADFPTKVLEKHWPEVPKWRDIRSVTKESFYDRTELRTVDVISGGFPCQPFSVAGKRKGKEDDRFLWPEMLRVISELQPTWVIGENVAGIISMALDQVLSDLEDINYTCQAIIIPACSVNAPHRRDRTFILGNAEHHGLYESEVTGRFDGGSNTGKERPQPSRESKRSTCGGGRFENVAYSDSNRRCCKNSGESTYDEKRNHTAYQQTRRAELYEAISGSSTISNAYIEGLQAWDEPGSIEAPNGRIEPGCEFERISTKNGWEQWAVEPSVGRVANGIPNRVERLKCLGNAVVPQQAYPIFKAIANIERGLMG